MYRTSNPVADAERYSSEMDEQLERLPVCNECGFHIQQERAVYIGGNWYCDECLSENRREVSPIW